MITWSVTFSVGYKAPDGYKFSEQFVSSSTDHEVIMSIGELEAAKRAFKKHCEIVSLEVVSAGQIFTEDVN